ncbi:MAG TPA: hypothetical protein VMV21_05260 [Vicinamibacteria bacterium]|nr:hypothetical protein [Vicinamibacteria bacterium]
MSGVSLRACLLLVALPTALAAADGDPVLDRPTLPAAGHQRALLTVGRFGRYALAAKSASGTSVQIVDRMAGPGEVAGSAGEQDGRLDVFLERGEYRVLTEGHPRAKGDAVLAVHPFIERSVPEPSELVETKLVSSTLDDLEQRSYWLRVEERRSVWLEAAGRNLADLRIWRDGQWLVDASPLTERVQPKVGQPLLACRLATQLDPGLYLVTAYGGPGQPWAEESDAHPLHLRLGLPRLPEAGRRRMVASPFGVDRFLVPGAANYFRVELPEAAPATLRAGTFDPEQAFALPEESREVTKKSLPPMAEIDLPAAEDTEPPRSEGTPLPDRIVTVEATAGQPYLLQHFDRRDVYAFRADGPYWISSIHSGHPQDSVDVTALVVRGSDREPLREQVVNLDAKTSFRRRANLLGTLTLFLRVKEAGRYEVVLEGPEARARIEPFLTWRPQRYQAPPLKGSGSVWDLEAGFYTLTAEPVARGIVTLTVRPKGLLDTALQSVGLGRDATEDAVRAGAVFPSVTLDRDHGYTVYLNEQPEVRSGIILRKLPLDPTSPLFVSQRPGETVSVPVTLAEKGLLRAETEDGNALELTVDGGPATKAATVAAGEHTVALRYAGKTTVQYSLAFEPARLSDQAALPSLPGDETPVAFETLAEGAPRFLDLEAGASGTYQVKADRAGLYVLESTGLLATEGNLRTRVVTSFARESQNGTGRNFELRQYLREGDYQLTVGAQAPSAGHLGVALRRTRLADGGFLQNRLPARATVKAGDAVGYSFVITTPGEFRVRSLGLGRTFRCRLEDEDGWPLVAPNGPADVTRAFEPGRYRFVVLPEATDARVVTLIEPVVRRRTRTGHGPHALPLAQTVEHVWLEPEEGQERKPDVWTMTLPAATDVSFALGAEMEADLRRAGDPSATRLGPGQPSRLPLAAGSYTLEVRSIRQNNRAAYTLSAFPEALLPGMEREVRAPAEVPLAVGEAGLVEIASFGGVDVKAQLMGADGALLAASDDRADDWNFQIARSLAPGRYRLRVDPVGAASGTTAVRLRVPREEAKPPLALPASLEVKPGRSSLVFPLPELQGDLLLAQVRSTDSVGLTLEAKRGEVWVTEGSASGREVRLEVPVAGSEPRRLRLWSEDRRDATARLAVVGIKAPRASESDLRRGFRPASVAGLLWPIAAARVDLERPGLWRVAETAGLRFGASTGTACRSAANGLVAAPEARLVVVTDAPGQSLRAERALLASGGSVVVEVPSQGPVPVEVAPSDGPLLVRARSRSLQPGLRVGDLHDGRLPSSGPMAVGPGLAVAVALQSKKSLAVAFAATPGAAAGPSGEATLEALALPKPTSGRIGLGVTDGHLEGRAAVAYELPPGAKKLRLALAGGTVAVLSRDADAESVLASDEDSVETVYTKASTLTLLHTQEGPGRFSIEATAEEAPLLATGQPLEQPLAEAGVLRLALAASPGATLRVRGAVSEVTFVEDSGVVRRGSDMALSAAGTLLVRHGRGPLIAWLEAEGQDARAVWETPGAAARETALPSVVKLSGVALALGLDRKDPALLQVRSATSLVTVVTRPGIPAEATVHTAATTVDAVLPSGRSEVLLRAATQPELTGTAELFATPIVALDEGLGPEVVLPPGASRAFSFVVKDGGPVGVGVRASAELVEATLLDASGRRLGTGVAQMPTLAPGGYVLVLHAPADGPTVRVRPAVAGLNRPGVDPPGDVVQRYLEPTDAPAGFSSRHVEAPAETVDEDEGPEGIPDEVPEDDPPTMDDPGSGGGW